MTVELRTTFRSIGERAAFAIRDSQGGVKVSPAAIESPSGDVAGITIFAAGRPRFTCTLDAALELYEALDEVLEAMGQ